MRLLCAEDSEGALPRPATADEWNVARDVIPAEPCGNKGAPVRARRTALCACAAHPCRPPGLLLRRCESQSLLNVDLLSTVGCDRSDTDRAAVR